MYINQHGDQHKERKRKVPARPKINHLSNISIRMGNNTKKRRGRYIPAQPKINHLSKKISINMGIDAKSKSKTRPTQSLSCGGEGVRNTPSSRVKVRAEMIKAEIGLSEI